MTPRKKKNIKYKDLPKSSKGSYVREEPLTVYKSGNSKVVTIPSDLPFQIGDKLDVSYEDGSMILVKKERKQNRSSWKGDFREFQNKYSANRGEMTIEELEDFLEGVYD